MGFANTSRSSRLPGVRLIVTNGCSYTRGQELNDPEHESWPTQLKLASGIPVVNIARNGASNRRIVRTTVELLGPLLHRHQVTAAEVLVIIMWTSLSRSECFRSTRPDVGGDPAPGEELSWHRIGLWKKRAGDRASRIYFRHLWDEQGALIDFLLDWLMLEGYLNSIGVRARFVMAWDILPETPCESAVALAGRLRAEDIYGRLWPSPCSSFRGAVEHLDDFGSELHPLAGAHKYFATSCLLPWLSEQGLVRELGGREYEVEDHASSS